MTTISVIGTAGRNGTDKVLSLSKYNHMVEYVEKYIKNLECKSVTLVSGGAAWADHVAVSLYLQNKCQKLELYLPAPFENSQYLSTHKDGRISNYYHSLFKARTGIDSLGEIQQAIDKGAKVYIENGFFNRNSKVARSRHLIAFGLEEGDMPSTSGTLHTWRLSKTDCKVYVTI